MTYFEDGYDVISPGLTTAELEALRNEFPPDSPNRRNLFLFSPLVEALVRKGGFSQYAREILGPGAFAVRAIFFNKIGKTNWHVPWHQDISIPVRQRIDVPGFSAFNFKEGVMHVNAPSDVLERLVTLRLHLDPATAHNGAMHLAPGSHRHGRLTDLPPLNRPVTQPETQAGEILRMSPLLFHSSDHSVSDTPRRVVHIEYAAGDLPGGLQWATRIID